jgi:membrane protease YdiL (CAAX protease family)
MSTTKALIRNHAVATYFALTFVISWGGVLAVAGSKIPTTKEEFEKLLPTIVLMMLAGPSIAGILLTAIVYGKTGLRELRCRLFNWRVGIRWYASTLLIAPALMTALLLGLSLFSPEFLPGIVVSADKTVFLLSGFAIALGAGIFEELGWTGFATATLRVRYGVLATGLIVGLPWAAWHLFGAVLASGTLSGPLSLTSYLLDPFLFLAAFRVLMVWVYDRTGSLLVVILMHASLTGSARIIGAPGIAGVPLLTFDLTWFVAVWAAVGGLALATRGRLSRQPLRTPSTMN